MSPFRLAPRNLSLHRFSSIHSQTHSTIRTLTTTTARCTPQPDPTKSVPINERSNDTAERYRQYMVSKPLNPHLTNTASTIANEFPTLGHDKPPADMLTSVHGDYTPKDSVPENTARMTGGTQPLAPSGGGGGGKGNAELDVGEIEGGKFKVEPLRREGEAPETTRARLTYQSRKRGTLESDLLLSTFADTHLARMTPAQMRAYDLFLDENDWDIYYWATQQPSPTSAETAEGAGPGMATASAAGKTAAEATTGPADQGQGQQRTQHVPGEWKNTHGAFKPAYRPVPQRWRNSEILAMLRKHVIDRSAGGVAYEQDSEGAKPSTLSSTEAKVEGEGLQRSVKGTGGGGLGMMPELKNFKGDDSRS